jgi:CPA2 family monovalent cation:H+ antiporter-2
VVAEGLKKQGTRLVLIEDSEKRMAAAHDAGIEVVVGNAASGHALELANVGQAKTLFVAIPNAFEAGQAVEQARKLNPNLRIIARSHSDEEETYLSDLGANEVIMGEREIGLGMLGWVTGEAPAAAPPAVPTAAGMEAIAAALEVEPALSTAAKTPEPVLVVKPIEPAVPVVAAAPPNVEPFLSVAPEAPKPPRPPEPAVTAAPEVLEAAIEAAHPEHEIVGPAEPPELVPALGEMPVDEDPDLRVAKGPPTVLPPEPVVTVSQPEPAPAALSGPVIPPKRPRPLAPAASPGKPFNPEVAPAEE